MSENSRIRLDHLLVERGYYATRSRARDAILRLCVEADGQIIAKPGMRVRHSLTISIKDKASGYVSRAALKLLHGLEAGGFNPDSRICLDIGASTGGFTQVLLERGAAHVYALDVGHGQLDVTLQTDPRVSELSGLNVRDLKLSHINSQRPEFLVSDVSFISLKLALPKALEIAMPGAKGLFLIKPQFEVGRENIGKGGIVCDEATGALAAQSVCDWLGCQNDWQVLNFMDSPITGGDGNREYIVAAEKTR